MSLILVIVFSFQEWFDFSAVEKDGGHEKIIAQEQEEHVLETLHAVRNLKDFLLFFKFHH